MTSTANWAGYQACYAVRDDQLVLAELRDVGLAAYHEGTPLEQLPRIGGAAPVEADDVLAYRDLDMAQPLSGRLLVARGFVEELYVHMGFRPAWKYEKVCELVFDAGRLLRAHDRSADSAAFRTSILAGEVADPDTGAETLSWINRTFELDYGRSLG